MSSQSAAQPPDVPAPVEHVPLISTRTRNLIIAGAVFGLLIVASFLFGYFVSPRNRGRQDVESDSEADKRKGNRGDEPEEMSCEWMKQCKRKREGTPPLLIISADGFSTDYLNKKETPTVLKMGECGGRSSLIPSFPSKTFPNHYSIVSGWRPGKHGIIENKFKVDNIPFDQTKGSYYGGEPIWNTAVKHGKTSKVYMWFGSYDAINGIEASFHFSKYERHVLIDKIDNVTDWLSSDSPPDLAMLYMEQPDTEGHHHGVNSHQLREAKYTVDSLIKYTLKRLYDAGVLGCTNIVLVSDHGMREIKADNYVNMVDIDPSFANKNIMAQTHVLFYENVPLTPLKGQRGKQYRIYRSKEEVPLRYHYDHAIIPFPYLCGNPGMMFFPNAENLDWFRDVKKDRANHGWDNFDTQMQAIFFTTGPSIMQNVSIPPFQNVELYNFFADLLAIPPSPNDGTEGLLDDLLVNPPTRFSPSIETKPCSGSVPSSGFHLASSDSSICSKSESNLFLLQSSIDNSPIAFEFTISSADVTQSAIDYAKREFGAASLVERAIRKLAEHKNIRIQVGQIKRQSKLIFASGFWCEGEGKEMERQCKSEKDTRAEAYVIPEKAEENFNDLPLEDLMFDYRVSISDIERETNLNLLPQSMDLAVRRRVSLLIPDSKWT